MATTATTATQELQESFLAAIRRSQEITLQAAKVWVETAGYFTPQVSYAHLPFANLWGSRTRPLVLTWASMRLARTR